MDPQTQQTIARLCQEHDVGLCYLFGSHVLPDDPDEMADVDIGIVPRGWPEERSDLAQWLGLRRALEPLFAPRPVDLVQLDRAGAHLQSEAVTSGQLLYSADEELRVAFEDRVLRDWHDFAWVVEANYRDIRHEIMGGEGRRADEP